MKRTTRKQEGYIKKHYENKRKSLRVCKACEVYKKRDEWGGTKYKWSRWIGVCRMNRKRIDLIYPCYYGTAEGTWPDCQYLLEHMMSETTK
jgi:hypothetical protein